MFAKANELIQKHNSSRGVRFYNDLGRIRDRLAPLDILFEGVCKLIPFNGGSAIWSAINYVFNLLKNSKDTLEAALDFFVQIGKQIPIIQTLQNTFRGSAIVIDAIRRLFAALIEFWSHAVKSYGGIGYHLLKATFSLKPRFEKLKRELDDQFVHLKDAATAQNYQNSEENLRFHSEHLRGIPYTFYERTTLTDECRPMG